MNIAIISNHTSANTSDLMQVCQRESIECTVYEMTDIVIDTGALQGINFFRHDVYIFRGYNKSYQQARAIAQYLQANNKIVLDRALATHFVASKLHEALVYESNSIPHPRTCYPRSVEGLNVIKMSLPLVVKDVDSQRGQGVRLCASEAQLREEVEDSGSSIILQEFIEMEYDVRVLCVGDTILGALKRYVVEGDFRSNVSLGARSEPYVLTDADRELALRAHRALGYDVSGVDITHDANGYPFIIETNITPEWQGFQAATGVDVAQHIINYAKGRFEDAKR